MKNLKKFAALLLAGAMALLMLTACGGGGSVNNPEEQKVLNQIGNQKGVQVTNDAQLRAVAKAQLDEDLNGQFNVLGYAGAIHIDTKPVGNDLAIVITARYDYKDTLLNVVLTKISEHVDTRVDASVNQDGIWSNVGVVVSSNNERSYIGIAVRIKDLSSYREPSAGKPPAVFCVYGQGRQKAAAYLLEGTRLLLLYRQLIAAGRSGPAGEVKRRLYQPGLPGSGERVHRPASRGKKAPEGSFAATLRGKG